MLRIDPSTESLLTHLRVWKDDREVLGRFFNTLSFLEHIGARKIHSCAIDFTEEHLRHAAEESRHALRFKRMAQKLAPDKYDDYATESILGGRAAFWYFQRIDTMVRTFLQAATIPEAQYNYLLVTYLVELRAASLYPSLQQFVEESAMPISLKGIIAEEDRHLSEIRQGLVSVFITEDMVELLLTQEQQYFRRLAHRIVSEGDDLYSSSTGSEGINGWGQAPGRTPATRT